MFMSSFRVMRAAASRFGKRVVPAILALVTAIAALGSAQQARAADEIAGRFTQSATYDCRTNTVIYEIRLSIPPDVLAAVQASEGGSLGFQITSDLPVGLKWISATMQGDGVGLGGPDIESRLRDSDRLNSRVFGLAQFDANGDGLPSTVILRGVAEVQAGMPLPHTFSHKAKLDVLIGSGGGVIDYALDLESEPPGGGLGTITKTGTPTEVTVDPAACVPDPADPGRPDLGEACMSADTAVYCGDNPGEYIVVVTGETTSPDFVVISVLTPGVFIDVMGSLETEVAVPVVAGTYYTELAIVGAAPGSAITLSVDSSTGDVGVIDDLPNGFALCCTTELIVVIPPECERRPVAEPIYDLQIEKSFNSGSCRVGEVCAADVTVRNVSDAPHTGDIVFTDSAAGKPFEFGPAMVVPDPWVCETSADSLRCTYPDADLAPGGEVSMSVPIRIQETLAAEIENCAEIEQQPDSLDENADNDRGCDTIPVMQPAPAEERWNLTIRKGRSDGGATPPTPCDPNERCTFFIEVENEGPGPHVGDIVIHDEFFAEPFTIPLPNVPGSAWSFEVVDGRLIARLPDANLAVHQREHFNFSIIPNDAAAGGEIENCAVIIQQPGSADTDTSRDSDMSCITVAVNEPAKDPSEPPPPPPPPPQEEPTVDLSITKTAPGSCQASTDDCTFTLSVRNESQSTYNGTVVISDVPGGPGIVYQGHSPSDWSCVQASNGMICSRPNTTLAPGQAVSLAITFEVPNNSTLRREGLENCGYLGGEAGGTVRRGTDVRAVQQALDDLGYDPGPIDGVYGRRTGDALRRFQENNGLAVTGTITPETLERLGLTGDDDLSQPFVDDFADDNAYCVTTKVTAPPAPKCGAGEKLSGGKCVSICPRGTEYRNGRCRKIVVECPRGQEFRGGRCRPIIVECPPGTEFRNGRCRAVRIDCPRGTELRKGECRPIVCPRGQRLVRGKCEPILIFCKPGEVLVNGKCVRLQLCPPGQEMRNGKCRPKRIDCPRGQEFRNGKCRPIRIQCPPGTVLRRGKCVPNQTQTPGTTTPGPSEINPGQTTRPIRCKRGETLINGRCVKVQIQIPNLGTIQIQ